MRFPLGAGATQPTGEQLERISAGRGAEGQREDFESRVGVARRFRAKFKMMRMYKKPLAFLRL